MKGIYWTHTFATTTRFRGCIHWYKDQISFFDGSCYVSGEEQVHIAALFDDLIQTGLEEERERECKFEYN